MYESKRERVRENEKGRERERERGLKVSVKPYLAYLFNAFFFDALKRSFYKKTPLHLESPKGKQSER